MNTLDGIERFDWSAEREAMRAPAYFRYMAAECELRTLRGMSLDERIASILERRERDAARLAGIAPERQAPAPKRYGPNWARLKAPARSKPERWRTPRRAAA
jgi:hypothetical protein